MLHGVILCCLAAFYGLTAWVAREPQVSPLYRDHFIRLATTDWRVDHSNSSIADGIDFTLPSVYPREVDYVLGLCQEATSLEAGCRGHISGPAPLPIGTGRTCQGGPGQPMVPTNRAGWEC